MGIGNKLRMGGSESSQVQQSEHVWYTDGKGHEVWVEATDPLLAQFQNCPPAPEASSIWQECFAANPQVLRMNNLGVVAMPVLPQLLQLTELDVSDNSLTQLPSSIWKSLPNLQVFGASRNMLAELPDAISVLSDLRKLMLAQNCLERLPSDLAECRALTQLDISHNPQLTTLPSRFAQFRDDTIVDFLPKELSLDGNLQMQCPSIEWWRDHLTMVGHIGHRKRTLALVVALQVAGERHILDRMIGRAMDKIQLGRSDSDLIANALEAVATPKHTKPRNASGLPMETVRQFAEAMEWATREQLQLAHVTQQDGYTWGAPRLRSLFHHLAAGQTVITAERHAECLTMGKCIVAQMSALEMIQGGQQLLTQVLPEEQFGEHPQFAEAMEQINGQINEQMPQAEQPTAAMLSDPKYYVDPSVLTDMQIDSFVNACWSQQMTVSFVKKFPETTQEFYKTLETAFVSVAVSFGLRQPQITLLLGSDVQDDDMKAALGKGPAVVKTLLNGFGALASAFVNNATTTVNTTVNVE